MDKNESLEIIENMYLESKKTLHRNSFYFLVWGILLTIAGLVEYQFFGMGNFWMVWPIVSFIGVIASVIYGIRESKSSGGQTSGDRITSFTWGAFAFTLVIGIFYALMNDLSPHAISLMLAGAATFISGGISKFTPFIWGGIILEMGAIICGFILVETHLHSLVFSISILFGYVVPGIILRKKENA